MTIVTRKGNPKDITTWDDLLKPGIEVVTPNPFSSGSAKWNLLAPYADKSDGGKNPQAGLDYLSKLIGDHIKVQPKSGREATETFLQGTGDVLLSYENEALFNERAGEDIEHHTPAHTFKIENPVAVVNTSKHKAQAQAFLDFMYSPEGQRRGPRPASARSTRRCSTSSRRTSRAGEALDDRRPRRLEQGQRRALRPGQRLRGQDLQQGDELAPMARRSRSPAAAPPREGGERTAGGGVGPLGLGVASLWLSIIVLLPLAAVLTKAFSDGPGAFIDAITAPAARAALIITVVISAIVALINVVTGTLIAWVLVRDDFRGKALVNAVIDLPFALPTIVA